MKASKVKEMGLAEASDFWDGHDLFEFGDFKEVEAFRVLLRRKRYVGLDEDLYKKISRMAKKLHQSEDRLISAWLKEKVG